MDTKNLIQNTSILVYHGISRLGGHGTLRVDSFEHQIKLLNEIFNFVSLNDLQVGRRFAKKKILLTFDDGFQNNYEYAVPVLKRLKVPALFFINNRHCYKKKFLWFSYLRAMEGYFKETGVRVRGSYYDFSPKKRAESFCALRTSLLNLEPHPSELYKVLNQEFPPLESFVPETSISAYFSGMSLEAIKMIADEHLFDIGIHTADHAFLPKCSPSEIRDQIAQNIEFIRSIAHTDPQAIAYPGGEYNSQVIGICNTLNIHFGFALQPISKRFNSLEIPRIGIYSPSLLKLLIKVIFFNQIHSFYIPIG
jgi:peptidoglycan/xylan/chitin deacetylase (PgdA/CDA1 family)